MSDSDDDAVPGPPPAPAGPAQVNADIKQRLAQWKKARLAPSAADAAVEEDDPFDAFMDNLEVSPFPNSLFAFLFPTPSS